MDHVALAQRADVVLIAPATANTIAKLAHGLADDALTTTVLATTAPVIVAPAMDAHMFDNPATQENVRKLESRGIVVAGPAEGRLASGLTGKGRMLEPAELIGHVRMVLGRRGETSGGRDSPSLEERHGVARAVTIAGRVTDGQRQTAGASP